MTKSDWLLAVSALGSVVFFWLAFRRRGHGRRWMMGGGRVGVSLKGGNAWR